MRRQPPSSISRFTRAIRKLYVTSMTDRLPTSEERIRLTALVTELNQAFGAVCEQMVLAEEANRGAK